MSTVADSSTPVAPKIRVTPVELVTLFSLGIFVGVGFCLIRLIPSLFPIAAYFGLLSLFHALEYLVTASFQPTRASFESFLLNHSNEYSTAIMAAIAEYIIELYLFPRLKSWLCIFRYIGLMMALAGQAVRTLAMVEAKDNFSHLIADKKQPSHSLVTTGIYKFIRHPAYTGFFLWTLGTQVVLGNPACLAGFYQVLTNFFDGRIKYEEETLVKFFGADYVKFKASTWSGFFTIP